MTMPDIPPELPSRTWRTLLSLLGRLPQGALSRSFGRVADTPIPRPLRRAVLGAFAKAVGIDVSEAEYPFSEYGSLNEFFVRRLRPGVRLWPDDPRVVSSPVDGTVGQTGVVAGGCVVQAKGRSYSAAELLDDAGEARRFEGGSFVTLYLSPRDYHRIHAPCAGEIPAARHVPGLLLPVNAAAVAHVGGLFTRNERLLCYLDGKLGRVAVVAVGAYNVGRISARFDPEWNASAGASGWVTNRRGLRAATHRYVPAVPVLRGEEIMAFHLGSTVVLLFEPGAVALRPQLRAGQVVRLGEEIGRG